MKTSDVDALIGLADETLILVTNYGFTGDHVKMIKSIRVLTAPLVDGDRVLQELWTATPALARQDLHAAVFKLHTMYTFSVNDSVIIRGNVQIIRNALASYQAENRSIQIRSERTIFYSWQSNRPNTDNRGFVLGCLQRAIKQMNANLEESERKDNPYEIDRDTQGVPGSPVIFDSILEKIDRSGVFIADVTLLSPYQSNSNVMVELGYAIARLGKDRILMVFNKAYGEEREAPFDLGFKRLITYEHNQIAMEALGGDEAAFMNKKTHERDILTSKIAHNVNQIIGKNKN